MKCSNSLYVQIIDQYKVEERPLNIEKSTINVFDENEKALEVKYQMLK